MTVLELPPETTEGPQAGSFSGRPLGWWGLMALIATEATMFSLLLFVYLYLWINADQWPMGDVADPELFKSGIRTVLLLGSSLPIHFAAKAGERGELRAASRWLATAWVMGAVFLLGHVQEWHELWPEVTPTSSAYGSAFYTITGFHALHLLVGLVVVAYLWYGANTARYAAGHPAIANGTLYWHFVDAVWVFVFGILYLGPRLW